MQYIIKKAKIKGMTLEVEMEEIIRPENASPITNDVTKKSDQLVHEDLQTAFATLIPHLVMICDQKEDSNALRSLTANGISEDVDEFDQNALAQYKVTGFVIGGDGESEGVTLIGQKKLDKKVLNLISPFQKYMSDDYQFGEDLASAISACVYEVEQYLFEGKCAVKQLEIPFDGDPDDAMVNMMAEKE